MLFIVTAAILSPMLKHRKMRVIKSATFGFGLVIGIGHVTDEEIKQGVFVLICEVPVCVAPFTIFFIETAVRFVTNH